MMNHSPLLHYLVIIGLLVPFLAACHGQAEDSREAAVSMAIDYVVTLSGRSRGQVPLHRSKVEVIRAARDPSGGWNIVLREGSCEYMVFAWPRHAIDITGVTSECTVHKVSTDARRR